MTRTKVQRVLAAMNGVRDAIDAASSSSEENRLNEKYARMARAVAPYVEGRVPYTEEPKAA